MHARPSQQQLSGLFGILRVYRTRGAVGHELGCMRDTQMGGIPSFRYSGGSIATCEGVPIHSRDMLTVPGCSSGPSPTACTRCHVTCVTKSEGAAMTVDGYCELRRTK